MKATIVFASLVIGIALITSSALIGTAIVQYGKSIEQAAENQRPAPAATIHGASTHIPSTLTVNLRLTTPNGEPFRIETASK